MRRYTIKFEEPAWALYLTRTKKSNGEQYSRPIGWWGSLQEAAVAMSRALLKDALADRDDVSRMDLAELAAMLNRHEQTIRQSLHSAEGYIDAEMDERSDDVSPSAAEQPAQTF